MTAHTIASLVSLIGSTVNVAAGIGVLWLWRRPGWTPPALLWTWVTSAAVAGVAYLAAGRYVMVAVSVANVTLALTAATYRRKNMIRYAERQEWTP